MSDAQYPPKIPGYDLLREVGRGAYGEVWLARHGILGTFHAIKIVRHVQSNEDATGESNTDVIERVLRGLRLYLERLPPGKSPAIAITHVGQGDGEGFFFYVMELADDVASGREIIPDDYRPLTLRELSRRSPGGCLAAVDAIKLGAQLASGLEALHHAGLVHRDIKPSNIVFVRGVPLLADIDLARPSDGTLSIGGSPGYVPREGPGRPTGDVFALGRTIYTTVTGLDAQEFPRLPNDWDRRPDYPLLRELNAVLLRACDENPIRRFDTAGRFMKELLVIEVGESVVRLRHIERASRWLGRIAAVAVPVALVATLIAWRLQRSEADKSFALYQDDLNIAAANLSRSSLGNARKALASASRYSRSGIETILLEHQIQGDRSILLKTKSNAGIDQIVFSGDGKFLAAENGNHEAYVFEVPSRPPGDTPPITPVASLTNISVLAGFLLPNHELVGTVNETNKNRPLGIWGGARWEKQPAQLDGKWIPTGIQNGGKTVAFLVRTNECQVGYWEPLAGTTPRWINWTTPLTATTNPIVQMDRAGQRILLRTQGDSIEDEFYSHLFLASLAESVSEPTRIDRLKIEAIALSWDGQRAAYADSTRGGIVLGMFQSGFYPLMTNLQHETRALAFAPDGRWLASGGVDQLIRLQEADSLQLIHSFSGHSGTITSLAWSADGNWVASGDSEGEIRLWWHPQSGPISRTVVSGLKEGGGSVQMVSDPTESAVAFTSGVSTIGLMEIHTNSLEVVRHIQDASVPLLFANGSKTLWVIQQPGLLKCVNTLDGSVLFQTNAFRTLVDKKVGTFGLASPDGRSLLLYGKTTVAIWNITGLTADRMAEETQHSNDIIDLAIREDSTLAVTVAKNGEAFFWSLAPSDVGKSTPISGITEDLYAACFVPGTRRCLLSSGSSGLFQVDIRHPTRAASLRSELNENYQMLATPDGKRVLVAGASGRLGVLRAEDGAPLVWFSHRALDALHGEHSFRRLLYLPRRERLLSLTDDGRLADW